MRARAFHTINFLQTIERDENILMGLLPPAFHAANWNRKNAIKIFFLFPHLFLFYLFSTWKLQSRQGVGTVLKGDFAWAALIPSAAIECESENEPQIVPLAGDFESQTGFGRTHREARKLILLHIC